MYRCTICGAVSQPRQARLTRAIKRADGSILKELALCRSCHEETDVEEVEFAAALRELIAREAPRPSPTQASAADRSAAAFAAAAASRKV